MTKKRTYSRPFRMVAQVLVATQVLFSLPVAAQEVDKRQTPPPPRNDAPAAGKREAVPTPKVTVNRTVPKVEPVPAVPQFSAQPTDVEITRARVFDEPLVPVGGPTSVTENQALAQAVLDYLGSGGGDSTGPLEAFLQANPTTAWRVALLTNLGIVYRRTGYFTRALASWDEAWKLGKGGDEPNAQAIADRALGELADLNSRLGRTDTLEALLAEAKTRDVRGSASEKVASAAEGLWRMKNRPEVSFRCGPHALASIWQTSRGETKIDEAIWNYPSTSRGTSLAEMERLGNGAGMGLQMAKRAAGADVLLPAMVHWRAGHFAAIVKREGERYLVQDPTFGNQIWVRQAALDEEASGYALVKEGPLPAGWQRVADAEGSRVWGKGATANNDLNEQQPCDSANTCCTNGGAGGGSPMAEYSIHLMLVNLHLADTPLRYSPPRGPNVRFAVHYNQREVFQPQIFYYSNLGPKWTFDWISYIQDDPSNPSADAFLYSRGGGAENYTGYSSSNQSYALHLKSRALLVRTSSSPVRYERRRWDGSVEVFGQADGSLAYPRKVFMTQSIDPQGNALTFTYDATLRLVAVTDALGQVTTLSYQLPSDPLKITKVTDPFGRFALFDYSASGRLSRITDIIGIQSEFDYGTGDFVQALTTPYGTSTFAATDDGRTRWVEATDPLGGKERVEYRDSGPATIALSDPAATVPTGFSAGNLNLAFRNTFYWDKRAMALYPGDYTKARLIHWLHLGILVSGVKESERAPLENRVWYSYAGQTQSTAVGTSIQPAQIARVLDDGTSQILRYEYNARGRKTKEIDPLGRETVYVYGTNNVPDVDPLTGQGVDLLQVKRKNGGVYDTLASYTYSTQHLPLTVTDALGKVTTYTYNAQGQLLTVTTPKAQGQSQGATTTLTYDTNGHLTQVSGPVPGATTSFTYDAYGRRRTATDLAGLVLTYDYDNLDRVTKVTYPDTTYEQTTYNRLDAEERRDRLGRISRTFHDAVRRPVATRDTAGQTTQYLYGGSGCASCGSGGDQLIQLIDPNGNPTSWDYDAQGRVTQETRANGSHENYTYETTTSRPKQRTDRKNVTTTFTYFLDGKLKQKAYSDTTPLVSYTYSPVTGQMLTAANGTDTLTWTYDSMDRVATEASTKNASAVGYSYDDAGNRSVLSLNGTTDASYAYDQQSRLTGITRGSNTISFGYDTPSRRTSMTYPNGVVTNYGYDTESRLTSIAANRSGTSITSFAYILDAAGNRTRKTTLDWAEDYKYDESYRLLSADRSTGTPSRFRFAYDPAGNRTADQTNDASMGATFNNLNQLQTRQPGGVLAFKGSTNEPASVKVAAKPAQTTSSNTFSAQAPVGSGTSDVVVAATDPAGNVRTNTYRVTESGAGATYTYDPNGNLTAKTEGSDTWGYEWNADNQLTRATKNSVEHARFAYDPNGRRVEKVTGGVTTTYTYDGEDILREIRGATTFKLVHGPGIDEPLAREDSGGALTYYQADGLGSVVKRTDQAGAVVHEYRYGAWGSIEMGGSETGHAFTGREWDSEIGLAYYRARYYEPQNGRFISEDPIRFGGGTNFYTYVLDNPISRVDPLGLAWEDWLPCAVSIEREVKAGHCGNGKNASTDPSCREAHCIFNCRTSRECFGGGAQAAGWSYAKEGWDWAKKKTWDSESEGWSTGDQNANKKGRCMGKSPYAQGWTCEELCRGTR